MPGWLSAVMVTPLWNGTTHVGEPASHAAPGECQPQRPNQTEVGRQTDCDVQPAHPISLVLRFAAGLLVLVLELVVGLAIDDKNHAWAEHIRGNPIGNSSKIFTDAWHSYNGEWCTCGKSLSDIRIRGRAYQ